MYTYFPPLPLDQGPLFRPGVPGSTRHVLSAGQVSKHGAHHPKQAPGTPKAAIRRLFGRTSLLVTQTYNSTQRPQTSGSLYIGLSCRHHTDLGCPNPDFSTCAAGTAQSCSGRLRVRGLGTSHSPIITSRGHLGSEMDLGGAVGTEARRREGQPSRAVPCKVGQGWGGAVPIPRHGEGPGHNILRSLPSPKSVSTMQRGGGRGEKKQEITTHFMSRFYPRTSYFPLKEKPICI